MTGTFLFVLAFLNVIGVDVLGWVVKTNVWIDVSKAFSSTSKAFPMNGYLSLIVTYVVLTVVLSVGVKALGDNVLEFIKGFTLIFFIAYLFFAIGSFAYIAVPHHEIAKFKIPWGLGLTAEAGFIVALLAGIFVGNFMPGLADTMKEACRPEMFVKIAIVIMGAELGVKAADAWNLASAVIFRGLCAIIEAYLIYWAVVYYVARKYFKFSREWAAPLASGISICGVSAAIATGGAIRARPVVPIMVSSLVVVFTCVEMLILPFVAEHFLYQEPMVAGGWMGLAVKSDGGAIASGAIVDGFIRAKALAMDGLNYKEGWIVMVTTTVKIFIDVFIGVWSFVLAYIWCSKFEKSADGRRMTLGDVWERFPRFVLGYLLTFLVLLFICTKVPGGVDMGKAMNGVINSLRTIFFVLTFFTIGLVSNFRKLWAEGIGRLAAVYCVCLFGFIIWIGLFISWLFFHGVKPPLVG
ncbi:MAG: YeiH family protein [Betaproteobacteria bacterium]|nr:YeiH family protein [Betaproteobacteria bacterium]